MNAVFKLPCFGEFTLMYTLISLILLLWLAGFVAKIGGGLIHGLLLVAGILFVLEMISGRRTVG